MKGEEPPLSYCVCFLHQQCLLVLISLNIVQTESFLCLSSSRKPRYVLGSYNYVMWIMSLLPLLVSHSSWHLFQNWARAFSTGQESQIRDWIHYSVLYFGLLKVKILKNSRVGLTFQSTEKLVNQRGTSLTGFPEDMLPEAARSLHGTTGQLNRTSNLLFFLMLISIIF